MEAAHVLRPDHASVSRVPAVAGRDAVRRVAAGSRSREPRRALSPLDRRRSHRLAVTLRARSSRVRHQSRRGSEPSDREHAAGVPPRVPRRYPRGRAGSAGDRRREDRGDPRRRARGLDLHQRRELETAAPGAARDPAVPDRAPVAPPLQPLARAERDRLRRDQGPGAVLRRREHVGAVGGPRVPPGAGGGHGDPRGAHGGPGDPELRLAHDPPGTSPSRRPRSRGR